MSQFTSVSVHNDGPNVVSFFVAATAEGQSWKVESGNYGEDDTHTVQVPADAVDITVSVHGEAFIDDWKTIYKNSWPDTTSWPADGLSLRAHGLHCDLEQ